MALRFPSDVWVFLAVKSFRKNERIIHDIHTYGSTRLSVWFIFTVCILVNANYMLPLQSLGRLISIGLNLFSSHTENSRRARWPCCRVCGINDRPMVERRSDIFSAACTKGLYRIALE